MFHYLVYNRVCPSYVLCIYIYGFKDLCILIYIAGLENREYGRGFPSRWSRDTLYHQKLALSSSTHGGPSTGIVRSRTQATELVEYIQLRKCKTKQVFLGKSNALLR
jgi:hypothetical protein